MTGAPGREALYIDDGRGGRLYALYSTPRVPARGVLLYIHPFAEEMNRSRRMVALAARAFVDAGWGVLQVDLAGCGDSSGETADACWEGWLGNIDAALAWLTERHRGRVVLWGLRAGCLLISEWLARAASNLPVMYWQPVSSGRQHMTHFLLLKVAGELPGDQDAKSIIQGMRSRLDMGGSVDVAGYTIGAGIVKGFEQGVLDFPAGYAGRAAILEVTSSSRRELTPILASFVGRWRQGGMQIDTDVAEGPAFWLTQEVTVVPALIELTKRALARMPS